MAQPALMPQVGQDIKTAILAQWKVRVGDSVKLNDVIAPAQSDKATFEVEAFIRRMRISPEPTRWFPDLVTRRMSTWI